MVQIDDFGDVMREQNYTKRTNVEVGVEFLQTNIPSKSHYVLSEEVHGDHHMLGNVNVEGCRKRKSSLDTIADGADYADELDFKRQSKSSAGAAVVLTMVSELLVDDDRSPSTSYPSYPSPPPLQQQTISPSNMRVSVGSSDVLDDEEGNFDYYYDEDDENADGEDNEDEEEEEEDDDCIPSPPQQTLSLRGFRDMVEHQTHGMCRAGVMRLLLEIRTELMMSSSTDCSDCCSSSSSVVVEEVQDDDNTDDNRKTDILEASNKCPTIALIESD
jgi:hypothetical protein